jgi:hypothetical protein
MSMGKGDFMAVGGPPEPAGSGGGQAYSPNRSSVSVLGTPSVSQPRSS